MKYIRTIIKNLLPKEPPKPVGRWRLEQCNMQMNNKVDLSNEDHCGPCGQYALKKIKDSNSNKDSLQHDSIANHPELKQHLQEQS